MYHTHRHLNQENFQIRKKALEGKSLEEFKDHIVQFEDTFAAYMERNDPHPDFTIRKVNRLMFKVFSVLVVTEVMPCAGCRAGCHR